MSPKLTCFVIVFWFAAFIAVAVWNAAGIREGAKDKKVPDGDGNCSTFKYGPEDKCVLSRATFGFGVVIWCGRPVRTRWQFADRG